jgi:hypothetical protein
VLREEKIAHERRMSLAPHAMAPIASEAQSRPSAFGRAPEAHEIETKCTAQASCNHY